MRRSLTALFAIVLTLGACEGFKEAMTAHVDVAAKAGSQELSVDRLAALLGQSKAPINSEIAHAITDLWVNYQLIGQAAAKGDSLNDPKLIDQALWPIIAQERMAKWHEKVASTFPGVDTTNAESKYAQGDLLAARHILFVVPQNATPAQRDSIRKRAEAVRAQATSANFADLAKKNSQDPGSASRGGDLGLFPKGAMVKEFQDAVEALKPGEISPVVQTQFGYHIIRRSTFPEVKDEFIKAVNQDAMRAADSTYLTQLAQSAGLTIKDNAVGTIRAAAKDLDAHAKDDAVLATYKGGEFTLGRLVSWVNAYPQKPQIERGFQQAPDSQVTQFLKIVVRNDLVLHQADSAKVELDSTELGELHARFAQVVAQTWDQLGVSPSVLDDSGSTASARERVAAGHIDSYMDKLMAQEARFVDVPQPVANVLRDKYDWKVNDTGLERAIQNATKARAAADSAKEKNRPASAVPLGKQPTTGTDSAKSPSQPR
ncbi:MAG TPA: peptidylprolyl isomerase [Gemmatimonadaceae bacterium]|nr:peptidylprolyl isomerase [Gemmatimonadaceae bacterium]